MWVGNLVIPEGGLRGLGVWKLSAHRGNGGVAISAWRYITPGQAVIAIFGVLALAFVIALIAVHLRNTGLISHDSFMNAIKLTVAFGVILELMFLGTLLVSKVGGVRELLIATHDGVRIANEEPIDSTNVREVRAASVWTVSGPSSQQGYSQICQLLIAIQVNDAPIDLASPKSWRVVFSSYGGQRRIDRAARLLAEALGAKMSMAHGTARSAIPIDTIEQYLHTF